MQINLKKDFPNIYSKVDKNDLIDQLRYFVVVDENYEDFDDEESDIFDPTDYNYIIYLTKRLTNILEEENLEKLLLKLDKNIIFENFLAAEEDLFGIKSNLSEEEIGLKILSLAENILGEKK